MAKSLKEKLSQLLYGRRCVSGKVYDGEAIKTEYLQMNPVRHLRNATLDIETTEDGERVQGEITVTVRDCNGTVCCIYLSPEDAEKVAWLLMDPVKG